MDGDLAFPDVPRSELERTVEQLVTNAQAVLRAQGRLRNLLAANRRIVERLDLEDTLRAVVEAGVELVSARYGALGVIGTDGLLERFIHVGMDEEQVTRIGHLPRGEGLLGAVVREKATIRLDQIEDDPRSSGFPDGHPPMHGFLGVPIRVRDSVYGNLYLAEPSRGRFTDEDEDLVAALAATAGVAIDNARLFDEARRRERWTTAMADVTAALLADDELDDVLGMIVDRVARFVEADLVAVVVPTTQDDVVRVSVATGGLADSVRGREYRTNGTLAGKAIAEGHAVSSDGQAEASLFDWQPALGPSVALPLRALGRDLGALIASRSPGGARFSEAELAMADEFSRQTSVALAVARGRRDRRRLERTEDRSRIARDLHDHVIQRLFAAGLTLQSVLPEIPAAIRSRIEDQVDTIDAAIGEIRTAVFALGAVPTTHERTTRDRVLEIIAEIAPALSVAPRITFSGPVDLDIRGDLAHDVVAVVRESLTNVARHAPDAACTVTVTVTADTVEVVVVDDGPGPGASGRRSGTANLAVRAELRGGNFSVGAGSDGGTAVTWRVPSPHPSDREDTS